MFFFSVFPLALSNGVLKKGAPLFEFGGDSGKETIELPNISLNDMLSSHNLLHVYFYSIITAGTFCTSSSSKKEESQTFTF